MSSPTRPKSAPTLEDREAVLDCIRGGTGTRYGIHATTGLRDRVVRECVRQLVLAGHPVVSLNDGGYHLATSAEEIRAEASIFRSREARERERAAALERHLVPRKQEELFA